ncbi:hypothetical protein A3Q05_02360 [Lactobacillus johnsonii]|mgnify:CR=1 FL=1|uniref:Uncharacterized protein n=2 Tax=Lactobacillus johnsonii TaxID=33959 RepID=A0A267MES4_LACJH|nr:hypothetical protein A3Q05_02360 [Lactobacillus johnsonii]PAB57310.1 hypothetical protein A3Q24_00245 [Lactobacillus johnsonii]PEG68806.1 hypothetical protein A3Q04_07370 [Lactobacillus johnsonii]
MNKRVLKRMEMMIVNHWRLSILFLLLASIFFFVNSQLLKEGIINTWTQTLIVVGKIFEYLGFMMIAIPIFEFINLRRDELKNVQVKKRN